MQMGSQDKFTMRRSGSILPFVLGLGLNSTNSNASSTPEFLHRKRPSQPKLSQPADLVPATRTMLWSRGHPLYCSMDGGFQLSRVQLPQSRGARRASLLDTSSCFRPVSLLDFLREDSPAAESVKVVKPTLPKRRKLVVKMPRASELDGSSGTLATDPDLDDFKKHSGALPQKPHRRRKCRSTLSLLSKYAQH